MNILRVHIACATADTEVDTLVVKPVFKCTPQILQVNLTMSQKSIFCSTFGRNDSHEPRSFSSTETSQKR